jgi:hypothetical protein
MRLDLTDEEPSALAACLTGAINNDALPAAQAFATANPDPISGPCALTYQTKKPL